MRFVLSLVLLTSFAATATPTTKKKPPSKPSTATRRTSAKRASSKARAPVVRKASSQSAPSSDRYKEIQDALVSKGYLKTPATGVWDQDSQDAMRHFQADQNLDVTGKLSARTLMSLGLGPKQQQ